MLLATVAAGPGCRPPAGNYATVTVTVGPGLKVTWIPWRRPGRPVASRQCRVPGRPARCPSESEFKQLA